MTYLNQADFPLQVVTLEEGQATPSVDELLAAATIRGHITDPNGNPVRGAQVISSGFPFPEEAITDIDGNYEVIHLHPGARGVLAFGPSGAN